MQQRLAQLRSVEGPAFGIVQTRFGLSPGVSNLPQVEQLLQIPNPLGVDDERLRCFVKSI